MSKRRKPGNRITLKEAKLAIGRAMSELEVEHGLRSDVVANYTTKFSIAGGKYDKEGNLIRAPKNTRNADNYDLDKVVEILDAHYNMDEFDRKNRSILTNKEILKDFILEGNQSKIIEGKDGKPVVKYSKDPRRVNYGGESYMYTPYTLLEKIENTTSLTDRTIKAFKTAEEEYGDDAISNNANISVDIKEAWRKHKNDEMSAEEFGEIVSRVGEEEKEGKKQNIFDLIKDGYKDAKRTSKQEGSRRKKR